MDLDAVVAEPVDASLEGLAFADDDGAEAKLADESCAVPAGGEGGDHDQVSIRALTAGVAEGVGLRVSGWVVVLDAAVVSREPRRAPSGRKMAAPMGMPPSARPRRASEMATASMA